MTNASRHTRSDLPQANASSEVVRPRKQVSFEIILGVLLAFKIVITLVWLLVGQLLGFSAGTGAVGLRPSGSASSGRLPVITGAAGVIGQAPGFIIARALETPAPQARLQTGFETGFGLNPKEAWAQERPPVSVPPPATSQPNPGPASRSPLGGARPVSGERDLSKREMALKARESALNNLEEDLNRKLGDGDIEAAKTEMEALVRRNKALLTEQKKLKEEQATQEEQLKSARIEHLVTAYRSMEPEQAANLINSMDDESAVAILGTMPGRNAGMILAFVNPEKAACLTKAISERRLDPTLLLNQADNIPARQTLPQ